MSLAPPAADRAQPHALRASGVALALYLAVQGVISFAPRPTVAVGACKFVATFAGYAAAVEFLHRGVGAVRDWPRVRMLLAGVACLLLAALATLFSPILSDVFTLVAAVAVGALLASFVDRLGTVLLISGVIAVTDVISVFAPKGATQQLAAQGEDFTSVGGIVFDALSISLRLPDGAGTSATSLGFADICFAALYLAVAQAFALGTVRMRVAMLAGLLCTQLVALADGIPAVPALPFLALAFAAATYRYVRASNRFNRAIGESPS